MKKRNVYKGEYLNQISFPLGGIGTGSIGLAGNGALVDWEIFNNANKNSLNGFSHFAIKAEHEGKVLDARVLIGDYTKNYTGQIAHSFGHGIANNNMTGLPHFRNCTFRGEYPLATVDLSEPSFPGKIRMTAFNPFIPHNADDSGIPAAFFAYSVKNTTDHDVEYIISGTVQNPREKSVNKAHCEDGVSAIDLDSDLNVENDVYYRALTIATDTDKDVAFQEYWFRGMWYDHIETYWLNFNSPGLPSPRTYDEPGNNDTASLFVRKVAKPGETVTFRFVISWRCPYFTNWWNPYKVKDENGEEKDVVMRNYYTYRFPKSIDSARYAIKNWDSLYMQTKRFHDVLFSSTLPEVVIDAVSATMSVLKTPTCLRIGEKGDFYGWEGLCEHSGSCEGSCAHVWNYVYSTCFLFPELERNLRETDYTYNQADSGEVMFRTGIPFGRSPAANRACVDGQMGGVMKVYREWKLCGDDEWLKSIWPKVKKSIEFAWSKENKDCWDRNCDGVLEGRQHHTLDTELFGPSSWLQGFYFGALRAGAEIARYLGDNESADKYEAIFEKGKKWTDVNLFNGEYYYHNVDLSDRETVKKYCDGNPGIFGNNAFDEYWNEETGQMNYQISEGCEIDQVLAQWHADILGLGDLYDPSQLDIALDNVFKNNYKESMRSVYNPYRVFCANDEAGTIMCSFPEGRNRPAIPILTSSETMHGFEYSFAGLLMSRGHMEQALKVVSGVRDKYDGKKRNPWNEIECGSNYARSMSSFSFVPILSGMKFDMVKGELGFAPKVSLDKFKCFWAVGTAWGGVELSDADARLKVAAGSVKLNKFEAPVILKNAAVYVDGKETVAKVENGIVYFENAVNVKRELRVVNK